jgi:hypothetical protein
MLEPTVRGFDPRAYLNEQRSSAARAGGRGRLLIALGAVTAFTAFGSIVVRASDDSGVYNFVRQQVRTVQPRAYAPQPVVSHAPVQFAPRSEPRRAEGARQQPRQPAILTSYAPFSNTFFPLGDEARRTTDQARPQVGLERREAPRVRRAAVAPAVQQSGGRVAYCVRTCDGFYFPVPVTGDDRQLETACNRMCPTAEVKVYFGAVGQDMDTARAAAQGKRYANLSNAFSYRRAIDKACACTSEGYGMSQIVPVERDTTLRVGDIVMTGRGLQVFNGGILPYRNGSFTRVENSSRVSGRTRNELIAMNRSSSRDLPAVIAMNRPPQPTVAERREQELRAQLMTPRTDLPRSTVARVVLPSPMSEVR